MSRNVSVVLETWQKFDLEAVKRDLDDKVIEIAKSLEDGDASRKQLIDQTKEFRRTITDDQRKLVAPILKSFQQEVDSATKRNKLMEQVLLKLYKQLIDLPDPVQSLENLQRVQKKAERAQDLEIENKQLRETLDEYNTEFAEIKNQEVTIKNLKEKIKELEEKSEQQVQAKLNEKEKELQKFYSDKEEHLQTSQLDLVKKLGDTESRCLSLQNKLEKANSDLYDLKSKQDEMLNAKSLEIEILMQDIDRLNDRVANAERLNEQYAIELSKEKSHDPVQEKQFSLTNFQTSALEVELAAKEKEISQLVDDIQKLQLKSNKTRQFYENQRSQLEEKLVNKDRTLEQMEFELAQKQDYDEIKKELMILKSIEFSEDIYQESGLGAPSEQHSQKSLEVLLLEKNRHLQNENTQFKNRLGQLESKCEQLTTDNLALNSANLEQKSLIVQLERDLLKLAQNNENKNEFESELKNESINSVMGSDQQTGELNRESQIDSSLFNIVSSQRERFRARVQELEGENMSSKQQVLFLTNEIDRLRSDNVKLYEKIKFLQSFSKGPKTTSISLMDDDDSIPVLNRYTTEYEKKLDPFSKFNYREKQRRYTDLKLHDKFTLIISRFIVSSKTARLIFFGYFFLIHLLIFLSLYTIAHNDASHRDFSAECAHSYREHMAQVHGQKEFEPPH
ncbi:CASP isoform X2 [Brachionus plicatilis]|uniref:Protein CASP n=1 Tax=Brachionus plicatilis TaxID=10195 RepID=A0A3M7R6I4_BRAPC|nr:CASP isoform X2 [Brachionus plicatilis]